MLGPNYRLVLTQADSWAGLQGMWVEVVSFLSAAWTNFTITTLKTWNSTQDVIAKGMAEIAGFLDSDFDTEAVIQNIEQDTRPSNSRLERDRQSALAEHERQSIQSGLDPLQNRNLAEREHRTEQALKES